MKKNYFLVSLAATFVVGACTGLFGPAEWIGSLYVLRMVLLVLLGWLIVIENRAVSRNVWHILLMGPIKSSVIVHPSGRMQGFVLTVVYIVGISVGILWVVNA